MDQIILLLTLGLSLSLITIIWLGNKFTSRCGLPTDIPWVGGQSDAWSVFRLHTKSLFSLKSMIQEGYHKYSKNGHAFVLPNIATGPEVILPMSSMKWLLEQPDSILNQNEVNREFLHADRTMLHENIVKDMVHGRVIRREMTRDLDTFAEDVVDEIEHALKVNWGSDVEEWKEVRLYDTMLDIIARISNRVLVGAPLCRDAEYLKSSSSYARNVVITAGIFNFLPSCLRPVFAPLVMAFDMHHFRKIAAMTRHIIERRALDMCSGIKYAAPNYSVYNDYIQWALHDAYSHDTLLERNADLISKRLTVLSFAAIQSSVITATNCAFDIAASPASPQIQADLRQEAALCAMQHPDSWFRRKHLMSMVKIDSTLRESMRLWGFISRGVMKKVIAPEGVTLPTGQRIPFGAKVGVTAYAIHHDEAIYQDAMEFRPFRFCNNALDASLHSQDPTSISMVTSSDHFMAFSHGRHACPGRFFAANQLKLLLATIVRRYDIQPIAVRPENPWLNNTIGPPIWSSIRVRRRKET